MPELNRVSLEALETLGKNIEIARCRRHLSRKLLAERAMITEQTYRRLAKGDGGVSLAVVLSVCQAMDIESLLSNMVNPELDEVGKAQEEITRQRTFRGNPDHAINTNF